MAVMNVCIQSAITDARKVAMRYLLLGRRCAAPCPARGIDGRLLSQNQPAMRRRRTWPGLWLSSSVDDVRRALSEICSAGQGQGPVWLGLCRGAGCSDPHYGPTRSWASSVATQALGGGWGGWRWLVGLAASALNLQPFRPRLLPPGSSQRALPPWP
jgi:hypothetical protein